MQVLLLWPLILSQLLQFGFCTGTGYRFRNSPQWEPPLFFLRPPAPVPLRLPSALTKWRNAKASYFSIDPEDAIGKRKAHLPLSISAAPRAGGATRSGAWGTSSTASRAPPSSSPPPTSALATTAYPLTPAVSAIRPTTTSSSPSRHSRRLRSGRPASCPSSTLASSVSEKVACGKGSFFMVLTLVALVMSDP